MDEEENRMASSGDKSSLLEPKEEPLDDFLLMAGDNETFTQSAAIMREEVKEEPHDLVDSFLVENESHVSNLVTISSSHVKKEPDQYIQDLVSFGLIPAWDAALDQSARYGVPPVRVEEPKEKMKEEVDSDVEQPLELADDFEPAVKKSRPNSKMDGINREFEERELQSQSVMKKLIRMKNDTELECPEPECKFRSKFVRVWIKHLKKKHSTTLVQAGLILRCKCGNESQTGAHIVECNSTNDCVVRIDRKITGELKCSECEFRTKSTSSWICHLKSKHSTTPQLAGLALLCECGHESLSDNHRIKCPIANFSIIRKRDGPIRRLDDDVTTPQCILCEAYPKTAHKYATHLRLQHESSLKKNNISIKCACGLEFRYESAFTNGRHRDECSGHEFTLHKVDVTTPQCVLCEAYPPTSYGYSRHIQDTHKSTMIKEGIFLICSCGLKLTNRSYENKHIKECNGREFTLHKIDERGTEPTAAHLSTSEQEMRTISNGSLLEPKEEPIDYSMSVGNEIPQHLFMGVDDCKKEELVDDEEVLNLPPSSSSLKEEPIVDEYVQDLARFGQQ